MSERNADVGLTKKGGCTIEPKSLQGIKLVVHIPENVHESTRQQKINRIYNILNPEISQ